MIVMMTPLIFFDNDEENFIKGYFDRFNFPKKNTDSFTVTVENDLADT